MKPAPAETSAANLRATRPARVGLALCALLTPTAAFAYLDPSTGSMVVSAIVGIFASIALAVKTYWYKIKAFFRRDSHAQTENDTTQEPVSRESGE